MLTWLLVVLSFNGFAQIKFRTDFASAKPGKATMLYFHFEGCGACKRMEKKVFPDPVLSSFINQNFQAYIIDINDAEGKSLNEKFDIQLHPSFLFLDENQNVMHRVTGYFPSDEFLIHAKKSLTDIKIPLDNFHEEYASGNRNPEFLFSYVYYLKSLDKLDSVLINEYLEVIPDEQMNSKENIRYLYEFSAYKMKANINANSRAYQAFRDHEADMTEQFGEDQVLLRRMILEEDFAHYAAINHDKKTFEIALNNLKNIPSKQYLYVSADGVDSLLVPNVPRVLLSEIFYLEQNGKKEQADKKLDSYVQSIWNDPKQLDDLSRYYMQRENIAKLEEIESWIKRAELISK